jgi:hypothetical protein
MYVCMDGWMDGSLWPKGVEHDGNGLFPIEIDTQK